jgi:hypothetical protein
VQEAHIEVLTNLLQLVTTTAEAYRAWPISQAFSLVIVINSEIKSQF